MVFLEHGAANHVYTLRCCLLKDLPIRTNEIHANSELNRLPLSLQTINVYGNVTEMWQLLMESEPSWYKKNIYACGYFKIEAVTSLFVNHTSIQNEGFKSLQNAIINQLDHNLIICEKDRCGFSVSTKIIVNAHVFIELDIRSSHDIRNSITCKLEDFPLQISVRGETLRYVLLIY